MSAFFEKAGLNEEFPFHVKEDDGRDVVCHHWHDEIEIIYVSEGTVKVGVAHNEQVLNPGGILIINSGEIHYFSSSPGSRRIVTQFNISIFDDFSSVNKNKKEIRRLFDRTEGNSKYWSEYARCMVGSYLLKMKNEYAEMNDGYRYAIRAKLYELLVILQREIPDQQSSSYSEYKLDQAGTNVRLEQIFRYVEDNYEKDISLRDAADSFGFDVYYFTKLFKRTTGVTFGIFLNNYRLTKAQWYLINGELPITDISYKVGYQSVKTFNRQFKSFIGESPSQFRKRQNMRS